MKYSNRSLWQRFISSPFSLVVLAVAVFILARASFNIHSKVETSSLKLQQAQANLDRLTEYQKNISRRVDYLSTDQGQEAEIRTKYHAIKNGEEVAVIVDDSQKSNPSLSVTAEATTSSPGFFGRILRMIGF